MTRLIKRSVVSLVLVAAAAAAVISLPVPRAHAYPEPSMVQVSWQLDFKNSAPERIVVDGKTYYFVRYTVTNNTGQDLLFTPDFQLTTDTGQVVAGNRGVRRQVFDKIKDIYGNLLLSPFEVLGPILQGDDNAKDSVAIFGNLDADTRSVRIFISSLSGETATVNDPLTGKTVVLHKTLELAYDLPGEQIGIDPQPKLKSKRWVMK